MAIDPKQIELTPEQKDALAEAAERTGKPWAEVLSEALRRYLPTPRPRDAEAASRSFYDALRQDGAIGIVKSGLPHDLSTNPKHMEGFGRGDEASSD